MKISVLDVVLFKLTLTVELAVEKNLVVLTMLRKEKIVLVVMNREGR
jgi:hypothetical protein